MTNEGNSISQCMLDMLYLISCAIHGVKADADIVSGFDLEKVYATSVNQSLTYVTFKGIDTSDERLVSSAECLKKWDKYTKQTLRKNLLLDMEREKLAVYLEENGIWFMPLKGSVIQNLYPEYGMRQMGDNDILFDASRRSDVRDYMVANGFDVEEYEKSHHDVYMKPPIYNFEMHTQLVGNRYSQDWLKYYENVKDRLILKEGSSFEYRFSDEDFYIYQVLHSYKHYIQGRIGLRHLLDTYVYLEAKKADMDMKKVHADLKCLGAYNFDKCAVSLSEKLFSEPRHLVADELRTVFSADEFNMLLFMSISDTYGTGESFAKSDFELTFLNVGGKSKLKYYMKRAFPDDEWWRRSCPFAYRHKWAKPFYNFYRFVRGVTVRRKKLAHEIELVNKEIKEGE